MSTISVNDFYQSSLITCFEHMGVMFKAHSYGTYPVVVNESGESSQHTPHISLHPYTDRASGGCYLSVVANGNYVRGRRNEAIFKKIPLTDNVFTESAILNAIDAYKSESVKFLSTLDDELAKIESIGADLYCSTRKEYEFLCKKHSVIPFQDSNITYEFLNKLPSAYGEATVHEVILSKLTTWRLYGIENEAILANPDHLFKPSADSETNSGELTTPPDDAVLFVFKWNGNSPSSVEAVKKAPDFIKTDKQDHGKGGIYYDADSKTIRFVCDGNYTSALVAPIEKLPELVSWLDTYFVKNNGIRNGDNWRFNRGAYSRYVFSFEAMSKEQIDNHIQRERMWSTFDEYFSDNKDYHL